MLRHKTFVACGSFAPVRVECEGGAAAWLAGTLAAPNVQGHRLPPWRELWPYQSLFRAYCSWRSEGLFSQSFSIVLPIQAFRGLPCLGSSSVVPHVRHIDMAGLLLCRSACQALKGAPWVGSYSVVQYIRCLIGQPLYCSAEDASFAWF